MSPAGPQYREPCTCGQIVQKLGFPNAVLPIEQDHFGFAFGIEIFEKRKLGFPVEE